ncbi:hypothetical protein AYI68_g5852, partial [Smittium mucronatum]
MNGSGGRNTNDYKNMSSTPESLADTSTTTNNNKNNNGGVHGSSTRNTNNAQLNNSSDNSHFEHVADPVGHHYESSKHFSDLSQYTVTIEASNSTDSMKGNKIEMESHLNPSIPGPPNSGYDDGGGERCENARKRKSSDNLHTGLNALDGNSPTPNATDSNGTINVTDDNNTGTDTFQDQVEESSGAVVMPPKKAHILTYAQVTENFRQAPDPGGFDEL